MPQALLNLAFEGSTEPRGRDESLELIKLLIEQSKTRRFAEIVKLSANAANWLLTKNPDNRGKKGRVISTIANDIGNKTFVCNGETVILSPDGEVNDGQNRLQAIVAAGETVEVLIAFGFARETRHSVDSTQAARSTADYLTMRGYTTLQTERASIASVLLTIERRGSYASTNTPATLDTNEHAIEHMDEIEAALALINRASARALLNLQTLCALYILFARQAGEEPARYFMEKLQSGANLDGNSPIFVLRERLQREKQPRKQSRAHVNNMMELIIRSWNHYRSNTKLAKLQVMGEWPQIAR